MKSCVELLKDHNIKPTIQRVKILEYLKTHKIHPSADEVYQDLRNEFPTISRATVYNALNVLSNSGIIEEIITPNAIRYDFVEKDHHHFYCLKCKKIYDIYIDLPKFELHEIDGHKVKHVQYCIVGICRNCLEKSGGDF